MESPKAKTPKFRTFPDKLVIIKKAENQNLKE